MRGGAAEERGGAEEVRRVRRSAQFSGRGRLAYRTLRRRCAEARGGMEGSHVQAEAEMAYPTECEEDTRSGRGQRGVPY